MRFFTRLVVCVGAAAAVAGCDPATDRTFFREGIGTELNSGEIAASTAAQNEYVKYVCQQAGFAFVDDGTDAGSCNASNNPNAWQQFVQAGMNDIDQRCDAYLLWLDYVRRGKDPTLNIIADAATYSAIIMDRAGVSAAPIAITGAALGFARNVFTNVTSRLILEVNHSAVQSMVLSAQKRFREDLLGSGDKNIPPVVIASKPAAIYALRSYLRLCMPVTIEAEINNTVVAFARGGPVALVDQEPLVSGRNVSVVTLAPSVRNASYYRLRGLLIRDGKPDLEASAYVSELLGEPRVGTGTVLNDATFGRLYDRISACLVARNKGSPCPKGSLQKFR